MSNAIAFGQCSTEEDLDIEWSFASGYDPAGKTLEVLVRERTTTTTKATLTVGSGLTIVGAAVKAKVAKATMAAWARMEYTADLVDKTGGALKRLVPTRITFDEPGKLVGGVSGNAFQITQAGNHFVVTATRGETGPVGPATTLTIGTVTDIAAGNPPTASLTGPAGAQVLNLGLVRGTPGSGAPNSADILAIAEKDRLERSLAAAGVPDESSLILDFVRGVHFASKGAIAASLLTLITAVGGVSTFGRASTGTFWDIDGLLKTAANNVPRLEYDPVTRLPRGLLLENQARTNLRVYSEQLDNASGWGATGATVTGNGGVAPDGLTTADLLVEDLSSGSHGVSGPVSYVSGTTYSASAHVWRGTGSRNFNMSFGTTAFAAASRQAIFDLTTGTVASVDAGVTATIVPIGGGRYKCSIAATAIATASDQIFVRLANGTALTWVGDGTSSLYAWGVQVEAGASASSYIPTTSSTVTRAAESCVVAGGQWVGAAALGSMTMAFEAITAQNFATSTFAVTLEKGSPANDYIGIREGVNAPGWDLFSAVAGVGIINSGGYTSTIGSVARFAFAADATSWAFANNNVASQTGGATTIPTGLDRLRLGGSSFMGHIRRVIIYPQRLSNTKVQALSNQAAWS